MCAIYGSYNKTMFEILHEANRHRGAFASSICTIPSTKKKVMVVKTRTEFNFDKDPFIVGTKTGYFLGHVQAPTSKKQTYDPDTSHPFESPDWVVAHNGVLTNFHRLNSIYCPKNPNPVDTSVLPCMLQTEYTDHKDEVKAISEVFSLVEGTFACYIVSKQSKTVYLVRQGSTLFYNDNGDFSSVQGLTMREVPEGYIL
ncbi:MAG: hypothetical protein EBU90_28120, partial [Proteobacteria bacterium]|nr:hypothetical protein [Pseudomonadota bacterium]